jgi:hypothetical protein
MFSEISGNEIHDIAIRGWVRGADTAGIKFLGSADMVIRDNHIYRCGQLAGIWLDWMAQGTQVVGNLLHDNADARCDLLCEVNHGPYLVANNLFLSHQTLFANSLGGAYAHNLMMGSLQIGPNKRRTAFLKAHSTELVDLHDLLVGDARWYNNLLASRCNLNAYNSATMPVVAAGNVFTKGATPSRFDVEPLLKPSFDPAIKLIQKDDGWYLELAMETQWVTEQKHKLVTTELLGKAKIPNLPFENPDGSALKIDTDYFGIKRNVNNPFPGPFEISKGGKQLIKVWPKP